MEISLLDMGKTKKRNVREGIISILSKEYPLSIRKIFNSIKKEYKLDVTYQAVFKLVKEMLEDGILHAEGMEYKLNLAWIKQLEQEISNLKSKYVSETNNVEGDKDGIGKFVTAMGSKMKEYIGKNKTIIFGISGGGRAYAFALWNYLKREGCPVTYEDYDKFKGISESSLKKMKTELKSSKVLVIDRAVYSGEIFRKIMEEFNVLKDKYKIADVKFLVDEDRPGLADFCRLRIN